MKEVHGLVERYGEKMAVNGPAFTARPGVLTGLLGRNTTAANGLSPGIPLPLAGDTPRQVQQWASAVVAPAGRRAAGGG